MTIGGELTTLRTNIDNITTSIINKGQSVSDEDTLDSYNDKILEIPNRVKRHLELCPEVIEGVIKDIVDTTSTVLRTRCFCDCQYLETASFQNVIKINPFAFEKCFRLKKIYLHSDTMVTLVNKSAFRYTPLEKLQGSIYVPPELYNEYIEDENWKYFKSIIKLIGSDLINTNISIMGPDTWYTDDTYQFI